MEKQMYEGAMESLKVIKGVSHGLVPEAHAWGSLRWSGLKTIFSLLGR